jgi:hypothetical protein
MSDSVNQIFTLNSDAMRDDSIKSKLLREYRSDSTPVDTDPNIIINCRDNNEWQCLNQAYLEISGTSKGTGADGVGLNAAACNIALEAGGASSLFSTARLRISNQLVESNEIYSHYTSFIKQLVNSCDDYTRSIAVGNSFVLDTTTSADDVPYTATFTTPGAFAAAAITPVTVVPSATYNSGFATRKALFGLTTGSRQRQTFYLPLRFLFDFCEVNKVLKAPLRIELVKRGVEEMVWGSGITSYFSIDRCSLWLPIIQPSLKVLASLETQLSQGLNIQWSYNNWRTYASDSQASGGSRRYTFNSQAEKPLGAFLYCKVNKDPGVNQRNFNNFAFDHCEATNVQLLINGMRYPYTSYQPIWTAGPTQDTGRVYAGLMEYLGKYQGEMDSGSLINISNHRSLYPIYYFDFGSLDQLAGNGGYQISVEMSCKDQPNGMVMFLTVVSDTQWNIVGGEQGLQVIQA